MLQFDWHLVAKKVRNSTFRKISNTAIYTAVNINFNNVKKLEILRIAKIVNFTVLRSESCFLWQYLTKYLRKRHKIGTKYLMKRKDAEDVRKRFFHEYLATPRERYNFYHKERTSRIQIGYVVIISIEENNRGKWSLEL